MKLFGDNLEARQRQFCDTSVAHRWHFGSTSGAGASAM